MAGIKPQINHDQMIWLFGLSASNLMLNVSWIMSLVSWFTEIHTESFG